MQNIAIVAALEREIRPLSRSWRLHERDHAGRSFRFYESDHVVLTCGGIGAEPARRAAEAIIALYRPVLIYSAGFAGALDPKLHIGDIIVPRRVVNAGDGSSVDTGKGEGVLVSVASVATPEQKAKLSDSYRAQAVDMEASAVARAADAHGVPFAAIKAISDESDFGLPAMDGFIGSDGRFQAAKFALFAAIRPRMWRTTLRLTRNSRRASEALSNWIKQLDMDKVRQPHESQPWGIHHR